MRVMAKRKHDDVIMFVVHLPGPNGPTEACAFSGPRKAMTAAIELFKKRGAAEMYLSWAPRGWEKDASEFEGW